MITLVAPAGALRPGALVALAESEAHHLRVRRAEASETVRLIDGAGTVALGTLRPGRPSAVEIASAEQIPRPAPLVLAVGAGDRERFAWVAEKATELGVTELVALETERTRGVATRVRAEHLPRLERRQLGALKQCGSAWAPVLRGPMSLADVASLGPEAPAHRWLADATGAAPPAALDAGPVVVVIGPEGGFAVEERDVLLSHGFRPVALGPHVLRFETAAVAAAAIVQAARARGRIPGNGAARPSS
ncbi:MAG: RsmE family RNA methyltransferase [Gemmatimonadota bacterium]